MMQLTEYVNSLNVSILKVNIHYLKIYIFGFIVLCFTFCLETKDLDILFCGTWNAVVFSSTSLISAKKIPEVFVS